MQPLFRPYAGLVGGPNEGVARVRSRRDILRVFSAGVAATVLPLGSLSEAEDLCQFHADGLAEAMKVRHGGGTWDVEVNHKTACAIIVRH